MCLKNKNIKFLVYYTFFFSSAFRGTHVNQRKFNPTNGSHIKRKFSSNQITITKRFPSIENLNQQKLWQIYSRRKYFLFNNGIIYWNCISMKFFIGFWAQIVKIFNILYNLFKFALFMRVYLYCLVKSP